MYWSDLLVLLDAQAEGILVMIPVVKIIKIKKFNNSRGHSYNIIRDIGSGSNLATLASETEAIQHIEANGWILQPDEVYSFAGGHTNDY